VIWRRVRFVTQGSRTCTDGLALRGQRELCVESAPDLAGETKDFLRFVVAYLDESDRRIVAGETLRYGYWLVKFVPVSADEASPLEVWEYNADATDFIRGGALSIRYWTEQHKVCRRYNAIFAPPNPETLTAVSTGVLEGRPAQGMRYPWPDTRSGWLIVTDEYKGDVRALTHHHTYHVTSARADLAPYIALPPGFGFDCRTKERVWYDEAAVREHLKECFGDQGLIDAGFDLEKKH